MKISEIPKEDLELMGYDEIALLILQESGKKLKLQDILKKIAKVLDLPEGSLDDQLMELFEQMSINKKFTMLKNGFWDLQSRHKMNLVIEDDEEDEEEIEKEYDDEEDIEIEDNEETEDIFYDGEDENEDVGDDDLADFAIVDGDSEEL